MKNTYLKKLSLPNPTDYNIKDNNCLDNLSKVNLFIGQNNSGKSRFIRKLFADFNNIQEVEIKYNLCVFKKQEIAAIIENHLQSLDEFNNQFVGFKNRISKRREALDLLKNELDTYPELLNSKPHIDKISTIINSLDEQTKKDYIEKIGIISDIKNDIYTEITFTDTIDQLIKNIKENITDSINKKRKTTYVPSLRTIRNLGNRSDDFLQGISAKQHFDNTNFMESIFTGEKMFAEINRLKTSKNKELIELEHFEKFISKTFFNNNELKLFAPSNPIQEKQELHLKIGEDEEYPISQLGDGIQQIILLTYPLFLDTDKEHLVFLDEPELHLHPGFQRIFLEAIKNEFPNCQFFIATHSNHFLDLTIEQDSNTSIFTFNKELIGEDSTFIIQNVSSPDHSVLDLIGVKNSSVFLTNCTIWVEGITDRLYIQRFLDIYHKELEKNKKELEKIKIYQEDIDFSFVEYGGANITHWSFIDEKDAIKNINIDRLCGKAFLITDNDGATETEKSFKKKRFELLKAKLGENYECLDCREIENLLTANVLRKTIHIYETNKKNKDIRFKKFEDKDYKDKPLGKFINDEVFESKKKIKTYANGKSGTLNDKLLFCKRALDSINSIDDLHPDAIKLCKKIYQFIESKNK